MMNIIKKNLIPIIALLIIFMSFYGYLQFNGKGERLSEDQINLLRADYPICSQTPEGVSLKKLSLEEWITVANTFVYGKVTGSVKHYKVTVGTGNEAFDAKLKTNGISNNETFFQYTMTVIDDSEGILAEGDVITISANSVFEDCYPRLSNNMSIVVPILRDSKNLSDYTYTADGMFYITNDGYALSAFEETNKSRNSGLKVDKLLENLRKK